MISKRIRPIYILITSYLISGLIHVFIPDAQFTNLLSLLFCGISICFWAISIDIKIIEKRVKWPLMVIAVLLLLFFTLQCCAYLLFAYNPLHTRLLWYAYYIPMIGVPLLIFYISLYIYNNYSGKSYLLYRITATIGTALMILVMTNEVHRTAFFSNGGTVDKDHYFRGPVYFICLAYICIIMLISIVLLIKKIRGTGLNTLMWKPCLVVVLSAGFFVLVQVMVNNTFGIKIWNIGETFALCIVGYLEICMYMGLIPSNEDYLRVFKMMKIPVQIRNVSDEVVVSSEKELVSGKYINEFEMDIYGGKVHWTTDFTKLHELNDELSEINNQLKSRNNILQSENKIKENREALES